MMTPRKLTDNFIATLVDDEVVLIDMAGGELFSLKGTGRAIWDLIDGERSREDIAAHLTESYEVEMTEAADGVDALLQDLAHAKLVDV